ncbi:LptM family lipoprotein [Tepidibacter sp. Z1-5]|uniref:LptM family lipoprotein n=1 Tax=Tepidibacter sp. Z1-5 TaxID=3134138 RepID=UPI0030C59980
MKSQSMKKIITFLLLFIMVVGITGCGQKKEVSFGNLKSMPKFETKDLKKNEITNEIFKNYDLTMINIWASG